MFFQDKLDFKAMARVLFFTQCTDDRFDKGDIKKLLERRIKKIKKLLDIEGITVKVGSIRKLDWHKEGMNNIQYRADFVVIKDTGKISWNDI
jgi:hypothetical protein